MKFLDANPFIYAYYRPGRTLGEETARLKQRAKEIVAAVQGGEEVLTTVVHVSEVANILKHGVPPEELNQLILGILESDTVEVEAVAPEDYLGALRSDFSSRLDPNDSLAVFFMRRSQIRDIYTFDKGFDEVEGIRRIPGEPEGSKEEGEAE